MMRWLKDKKKDKRSSSVGGDEDGEEDDYGFEKDKSAASKSPITKRQLPPTPLTPEERSPHIYEEIHDLQLAAVAATPSENGKTSPQKYKKYKHGIPGIGLASGNVASSVPSTASASFPRYARDSNIVSLSPKDDSISPYMVVPVDEEVRQTPTIFHRDGTPEVHCDVIVKDTHCEILLSRKPKVSAFRLDSTGGSECNSAGNVNPAIRNNTHFCSRNRRASVDVHSAGGKSGSSSGAWNSSAFSSSSTSRVNSVGTSMMSLSTLSERHPGLDDNGSSGSSAKGVMTYTAASNFIPRATKLAFNPLKPLDGDDTSLSNQDPFFSMMPPSPTQLQPQQQQLDLNNANFKTVPQTQDNNSDKPVVYSSNPNPNTNPNFPLSNPSQPHNRSHMDSVPPFTTNKSNFVKDAASFNPSRGYNPPEKTFHAVNIIRVASPSDSSSCTYASVSFPAEPKVYNTIAPDLISQETTREQQAHTVIRHLESSQEGESETESVRYSSIQETPPFRNPDNANTTSVHYGVEDSVYSGVLPFRINGNSNITSKFCGNNMHHFSQVDQNQHCINTNLTLNSAAIRSEPLCVKNDTSLSTDVIYSGIVNQCENNNNNTTVYACIENTDIDANGLLDNINNNSSDNNSNNNNNKVESNVLGNDNLDTSEADVDRILYGQAANSIVLDFCTCSDDQQSTACGFLDLKPMDDDTSSIATTINDARGSCTGCGRLIRQITYSESYSDETYEHVYSSRLLVRKGRRFSSPDITLSEISNSETTLGFDNVHGQENIGHLSRDDSWTGRNNGVSSTFYRPLYSGSKNGSSLFLNAGEPKENKNQIQQKTYGDFNSSSRFPQRQSFSAYGQSSSNSQNIRPDCNSTTMLNLSHHRPSLPASLPSNLIPVPSSTITSSATSQLQPKTSAFSNLLSKFSRPKSKHSIKSEQPVGVENVKPPSKSDDGKRNIDVTNVDSDATEQIPEKNTTMLSKFFQRLSTNDTELTDGLKAKDKKRDENSKSKGIKVDVPSNSVQIPKMVRSPLETKSENLNHKEYSAFKYNNNNNNLSLGNVVGENIDDFKIDENNVGCSHVSAETSSRAAHNRATVNPTQKNETNVDENMCKKSATSSKGLGQGVANTELGSKPPNKTDSGDTCYEYDISTSSEGEQTGYDYFLAKVKKSLNLEKEVQQIADMNALRRKMFCKKCKKSNVCGVADNEDYESFGSDVGCPHLSTNKYGDLRKIFGDIVVDQRAAILDCLTNYAHGPFNVKCEGRDNTCRECGCEIMTSDSESMTTVYSILSQQFRMTSPGTHTPSCDSDDGTMADNSCESADDEDNDYSSGYDEAVGPVCEYPSHRVKKREKTRDKKERRGHHSGGANNNISFKDQERSKKKTSGHAHHPGKRYHSVSDEYCVRGEDDAQFILSDKHERLHSVDDLLHSAMPLSSKVENSSVKNVIKGKELVYSHMPFNNPSDNNDNEKDDTAYKTDCDQYRHDEIGNKPRPSAMATEKVIQDIYAPLPSKALSLLTARCETRSGAPCCCARPPQSSSNKLIQALETDNGTCVPPTAPSDNAGAMKNCGMSSAGHIVDNSLTSVQTHCECSHMKDQTVDSACLARTKGEQNKSPMLSAGQLNSDKLSSVDEVEKLDFNSTRCHFECCIEKDGRVNTTNHASKSLEHVFHRVETPSVYSKYVIDNVVKEPSFVETSHYAPGRVTLSPLESNDGSAAEVKGRRQKHESDSIYEKKSDMSSLVSEVDVNQKKKQDMVTLRQKQKQLQMVDLDLLPETALGGDGDLPTECNVKPEVKIKSHRVKSNMVERLAKLFEDNDRVPFNENDVSIDTETIPNTTTVVDSVNTNRNVSMDTKTSAFVTTTINSHNYNNNNNNNTSTNGGINSSKLNTVTPKTNTIVSTNNATATDTVPTKMATASKKIQEVTKFDNSRNISSLRIDTFSPSPSSTSSSSTTDTTTTTTPPLSVASGVNHSHKRGSIVKNSLHPPTIDDHPDFPAHLARSSLDKNKDHGGKNRDTNINALPTSAKPSGLLKNQNQCLNTKSKSDKKKETKDERVEEKEESGGTGGASNDGRGESRSRKPNHTLSPSPSSSSGSSSRRKGHHHHHHTRHKKLSKRTSHVHKRTRSKSERRKSHHHHHHHHHHHESREENTPYYFSSDLSDIDTIEVENWETYSSAPSRNGVKAKSSRDPAYTKPEMDGRTMIVEKDGKTSRHAQDSSMEQGEDSVIQEIYSIPPSSSEIRGVAAAAVRSEDGRSPSSQTSTPELVKANKGKKSADIYKTKKSNNKLLSDLIIRNYDRQMYDVGSSV